MLHQNVGAHAGVDSGGWVVLVARAVEVAGSKAERRETGVDVGEEVVVVGHAKVAGILAGVAVRVADQGSLPLE